MKKKKDLDKLLGIIEPTDISDIDAIAMDSYGEPFSQMIDSFPRWQEGLTPLYIRFTELDDMIVLVAPAPITNARLKAFEDSIREDYDEEET